MHQRHKLVSAMLWITFGLASGRLFASAETKEEQYTICPERLVGNDKLRTLFGRSPLDCIQMCTLAEHCSGVSICHSGHHEQVTCSLSEDVQTAECDDLNSVASPSCHFVKKDSRLAEVMTEAEETTLATQEATTTEIACQNGGTPNGEKCDCPVHYGGRTCNRLIRDCSEPFQNGHTNSDYDGIYAIQPATAPSPIEVKCQFRAGGETWPLRRRGSTNFCQDWATCKAPYNMQDLLSPHPEYFIGLENLHHLLSQAEYKLRVYMLMMNGTGYVSKTMHYTNFSVDAESSSFAVTHDGFDCTNCDADDAFSGSLPVVFVSGGHDVNGCSAQRGGKSGWFGSNCKGSDLFSNGLFYWPVNGTDTDVRLIEFAVTRVSTSFYDD
ncbi:microfibril-associated glycoprotein 4-like [Littorina saxatilis]|uniref:microfibril-associated glycoprotein 4-like n=1 Tax=Littorina saxatilis TaxID=31220 RepID=UPI0038B4F129